MSLSNFFKYTGGPQPRVYIFSSNPQATIIESPNDITQLAFLTNGKESNSISFISTSCNISIYDRTGSLLTVERSENSNPTIFTDGSIHTSNGYYIRDREVISPTASVFASNLYVEGTIFTSNLSMHDYEIKSSSNQLQFLLPTSAGSYLFGYSNQVAGSNYSLSIFEGQIHANKATIGTVGNTVELFTVHGRARIDRGVFITRPFGSNTVVLSDATADTDNQVGTRMVVFREYLNAEGASTRFSGIGFDGGMVYTTASADQNHTFYVLGTTQRPVEAMRIGANSINEPRVGIGFSSGSLDSPTAPLHVKGNTYMDGNLFVSGRFEGPINLPTKDESGRLRVTDLPDKVLLLNANNKVDDVYLPVISSNLNLFRSSLNVGVGTRFPKQKLHVYGSTYIEQGRLGINVQEPSYPLHIINSNATEALYVANSLAGGDHMVLMNSNGSNFVVTGDGRLGIKTRPEVGYALHVDGVVKANALEIPSITLDTIVASNIQSGGLTTNTSLNGIDGVTLLTNYTFSTGVLSTVDIEAYPSALNNYIKMNSKIWSARGAPFIELDEPNEGTTPQPLSNALNVLQGIRGWNIEYGFGGAKKPSFLVSELSTVSNVIAINSGKYGYQINELYPYLFSGVSQLITSNATLNNTVTQLTGKLTTTSNALEVANSNILALQQLTSSLQSNLNIALQRISQTELQTSNLNVRVSALESA